uniref:MFS domain-containing protein n=1 Tax=Caenorhabditis japonica TaxID=281687 RepID=A0A8R1DG45_CAEJA
GLNISANTAIFILIPAKYRGLTNSLSGLIGNIAFLLAASLGTPFLLGTETNWQYIFYLEVFPCIVHILVNIFYFHDSPNYLLSTGKSVEAEASLKVFYGEKCGVKRVLEDLRANSSDVTEKSLRYILSDKSCVQALSLSVAVNFSVSFSGIVAISFFGTFLLQNVGFSAEGSTVANSVCSVASIVSALLAVLAIDKKCHYLEIA